MHNIKRKKKKQKQQVDALREWIVDEQINFIIVDIENQEIVRWINY